MTRYRGLKPTVIKVLSLRDYFCIGLLVGLGVIVIFFATGLDVVMIEP